MSLARQHFQRMTAASAAAATAPGAPVRANAYELQLIALADAKRALKQVQSVERKVEVKRRVLPQFGPWVNGVLDAGRGDDAGEAVALAGGGDSAQGSEAVPIERDGQMLESGLVRGGVDRAQDVGGDALGGAGSGRVIGQAWGQHRIARPDQNLGVAVGVDGAWRIERRRGRIDRAAIGDDDQAAGGARGRKIEPTGERFSVGTGVPHRRDARRFDLSQVIVEGG